MINKPLSQIGKPELESLVDNAVKESRTIEYKQTLPGPKEGDKKEFLADVSSFANASGGDLLFGIAATDGVATSIVGLDQYNDDKARLALESMIRDGLDPRIPGIQLHTVDGFVHGPVLLMRIPRSWIAPHMVSFQGNSRFYTRSSNGKYQMDVVELRNAFEGSGQLPKRIAAWRADRVGRLIANEGPFRLGHIGKGLLVLHLIPVSNFEQGTFDIGALQEQARSFTPMDAHECSSRINLEGVLNYMAVANEGALEATSYTQIFRNGSIEAACDSIVLTENSKRLATDYEGVVRKNVLQYVHGYVKLGVEPPILLMLTLHGVQDARMSMRSSGNYRTPNYCIDRDTLSLPDVLVSSFDEASVTKSLQYVFDQVWNASGHDRSPNFDGEGKWIGN